MKKFVSFILMLALSVLAVSTVFAADGTGDRTIDVKAKYQDNTVPETVYSVEVSWGAMQFTCTAEGGQTWNPDNHSYSGSGSLNWTAQGNTVTVVNHSNTPVTASFRFNPLEQYSSLTGSFDTAEKVLKAGIVGGYDSADKVTAALTLSGQLDQSATQFTKVGTITVSIR